MGQKIHPTGFRLPVTRNWSSRWYASNKNFSTMLVDAKRVKVMGRRRVVVPASGANAVEWTDLGAVVNRLVHGSVTIAMGEALSDPAVTRFT